MMTKYFVAAFIVAIPLVVAAPETALAGGSQEPPTANDGSVWAGESGTASYYGPGYHGRRAAGGTRFDQMEFTAAHPWLPFGTKVKVTVAATNRTVVVTITDRLHYGRRIVDLSLAAARQLGMLRAGVAEVSLVPV
jgi:rare lipoprotein A